ncbi:MAG: hypothetical protein WD851_08495 [Pirellulales bacterium]
MRRPVFLLAFAAMLSLAGCSVYDVLFGMFGSNYSSTSPDNPSRIIEMRDELDRWEQRERQIPLTD